ncbi:MAG: hypothetical protein AAGE61_04160 [Pseudomonadota bacterium]
MPKYKTEFKLGLDDIELIETNLHRRKGELANQIIDTDAGGLRLKSCGRTEDAHEELKAIRDLLGRIHNQKIWFEPDGAPLG